MHADDNPYKPPDTLEADAPGESRMQVGAPGLAQTAIGLSLVYYGIVLLLLSILSLVVTLLVPVAALVAALGIAVAYLMLLVGPLFCLAVPSESGSKGLIVSSILLQLLAVGVTIVTGLAPAQVADAGQAAGSVASLLSAILFVMFLRKLAIFVGRHDLSSKAETVLRLGLLVVLLTIGIAVASLEIFLRELAAFMWILPIILSLVVFVMYANLVNSLRLALGKRAAS